MSDTPLPEGIAVSPGGGVQISLNPAAMRAARAGIPAEARASAFGTPAPAPVTPAAQPDPAVAPPMRFTITGDPGARYHDSPAADHIEYLNRALARGQITAEGAAAALAEAGITASLDGRSPAQQAHDERHGVDPAGYKPTDYGDRVQIPGAADLSPEEFAAADTAIRGALAGFGIAPASAQNFVKAIDAADDAIAACRSPEQHAALVQRWQRDLQAVFGEGVLADDTRWQPIAKLADALKGNPLVEHMRDSGIFFNPQVALALLNRTAATAAWRAGRPK